MKKYLLLILFSNLLLAEDLEVNKAVQGVNQKNYIETGEINKDNTGISTGNIKLMGVSNIENENTKEKVSIKLVPKEEIIIEEQNKSILDRNDRDGKFFIGLGGHRGISDYNYGLYDSSRMEKYGVNYDLYIKRETFEYNRENSKNSSDFINANFEKDKINVAVSIKEGVVEYPGMDNAVAQVKSDKEFTNFDTSAAYKLAEDTTLKLKYSINNNNSESLVGSAYTRDYKNSYLELSGIKEFLYKDLSGSHSIDTRLALYGERTNSDNKSVLYVEGKDRFSLVKIPETDFIGSVRLESGKKTNLSANLNAAKKLDENVKINAGLDLKSSYKLKKDIIKDFTYSNDIVDFKSLDNEQIFALSGGMTYIKDNLYVNLDASINTGKKMITYEATEVDLGKERAIVPTNYNENLSWLETKVKTSYTRDENIRGEANLTLSSLKDLAYKPNAVASIEGIYTKNSYEGRLKYNFNGSMYSKNKGVADREIIGSYGTVDILNSYTLKDDYLINLNLNNIFNSKGQEMKGYAINGRVISLSMEIKY